MKLKHGQKSLGDRHCTGESMWWYEMLVCSNYLVLLVGKVIVSLGT